MSESKNSNGISRRGFLKTAAAGAAVASAVGMVASSTPAQAQESVSNEATPASGKAMHVPHMFVPLLPIKK